MWNVAAEVCMSSSRMPLAAMPLSCQLCITLLLLPTSLPPLPAASSPFPRVPLLPLASWDVPSGPHPLPLSDDCISCRNIALQSCIALTLTNRLVVVVTTNTGIICVSFQFKCDFIIIVLCLSIRASVQGFCLNSNPIDFCLVIVAVFECYVLIEYTIH